ncbi:MAG: hypothetical protein AAGU75_20000 [Bacillota bacterium]
MEANLDARFELAKIMECSEYVNKLKDCDEDVDLFWDLYTKNVRRYDLSLKELSEISLVTGKAMRVIIDILTEHINNHEQPKEVKSQKWIYKEPSQEQIDQWESEREEKYKNKKIGGGKFLSWLKGGKLSAIELFIFKKRIELLIWNK